MLENAKNRLANFNKTCPVRRDYKKFKMQKSLLNWFVWQINLFPHFRISFLTANFLRFANPKKNIFR